jgi:hypothetical protein
VAKKEELNKFEYLNLKMACVDKAISMMEKLLITDPVEYKKILFDLAQEVESYTSYQFYDDVDDELTGQTIH